MSEISRTSLPEKLRVVSTTAGMPKGIRPFTETPSRNRQLKAAVSVTGATELFSLFTADIIKANSNFVR